MENGGIPGKAATAMYMGSLQDSVDFWRQKCKEAEAIIERLTSERRWIPVSEALPKVGPWVLACVDDGLGRRPLMVYRFDEKPETFWLQLGDGRNVKAEHITHWMPLPTPPAATEGQK